MGENLDERFSSVCNPLPERDKMCINATAAAPPICQVCGTDMSTAASSASTRLPLLLSPQSMHGGNAEIDQLRALVQRQADELVLFRTLAHANPEVTTMQPDSSVAHLQWELSQARALADQREQQMRSLIEQRNNDFLLLQQLEQDPEQMSSTLWQQDEELRTLRALL